jgi:hypothetical protein
VTTLSNRGLNAQALAELKKRAAFEDASVNAVVLKLLEQCLGTLPVKLALKRHHDLDALAGTWTAAKAAEVASSGPLQQVNPALWS